MDSFSALMQGFAVALRPDNVAWAFLGVVLGTVVGILPGIGVHAAWLEYLAAGGPYARAPGFPTSLAWSASELRRGLAEAPWIVRRAGGRAPLRRGWRRPLDPASR